MTECIESNLWTLSQYNEQVVYTDQSYIVVVVVYKTAS